MPDLLTVQRSFVAAIRSRDAEAGLLPFLTGDAERNTALIALYRGNSAHNALGALRLAYPVCEQIVGAACFAELSRLFWHETPATEGDLNQYGESLAECILSCADFDNMPWLADVARLEWQVHKAGMAADHQPLELQTLAAMTEAGLAESRLRLQAATHIMPSDWPIASIWQQHQPDYPGELDLAGLGHETALIHRIGYHARVNLLSSAEAACVHALMQDETVLSALQAGFAADAGFSPMHCLQKLFSLELITHITPGETS